MEKISKRDANRLERRSAIIAVARAHFFEHGYAETSMSAIAAALGGSKGTLWSYFASKEELFAAVIEDTAAGIQAQLDFADPGDSPFEQMIRLCRSFIDCGTSPLVQAMMRLVISEGHRRPEIAKIFYERGPSGTQQLVARYLEEHFADHLWVTDYVGAGKTLVALCMEGSFYYQLWGITGQPTARERQADARKAAMLFLRGYGTETLVRSLDEEPSAAKAA